MTDSSKTLSIKIQAEDGASKTFQAVSDSARSMADVFEDIVNQSGDAFDGVSDSAQEMGSAVEAAAEQGASANQQLVASAKDVADAYKTIGQTLSVIGGAGTAFFGYSTSEFNTLEAAMRNVNSIAGLTDAELKTLTGTVRQLGVDLAIDPSDLADGLYDIQGSGFEAAEALGILETAAIAARAGLTNTGTAAQAITAVLNAYGKSADQAGNVSDILFKVVDSGVISFEMLARNMGAVLPIAASLKVPLEEIAAAYAELTIQGISGPQAETGIAALMRSALRPTQELTDALKEQGYVSAELLIQQEGLVGFLDFLMEASGGSSSALSELLGTTEATTAAMALMRNEGQNYIAMLGEMEGAAQGGARTLEVFGEQTDTTMFALQQAAAQFREFRLTMGEAISPFVREGADAVSGFLGAINSLPGPVQTAISLFGALGSAAALATGGLILALPKILEIRNAIATLGGMQGIIGAVGSRLAFLSAALSPLGLALGAVALVGGSVVKGFLDQKAAADEYRQSVSDLEMTLETLRRQGDTDLANAGDNLKSTFENLESAFNSMVGNVDVVAWFEEQFGQPPPDLTAAWGAFNGMVQITQEEVTELNQILQDALTDPSVNAEAWIAWAAGLISAADSAEELDAAIDLIKSTPLSDFSRVATETAGSLDTLGQAAENAAAPVAKLLDIFTDLPAALDDLRLDGQGALANDLEAMSKRIEDAFIIDPPANPLSPLGIGTTTGELIQSLQLTEAQLGSLDSAWSRVWSGMQSGVLDNVALMADWNAILADSTLTDEQKVVSLTALSNSLSTYYDSAKAMQEQQKEFLADGDNVLDWWLQYQDQIRAATLAQDGWNDAADKSAKTLGDTVTPIEAAFEASVQWALGMNDASDALDQALRTFGQIDSLAQRSASSASIADTLIGAPGELGELQDLWSRIQAGTSDARLEVEQYNAAIDAGIAIQESNVRVQDDLNVVRAMQIPLLEQQQLAYERNIASLTTMTAQEQQHALMLQDAGIQAQIAQQYSLAYSASIGEIPKEVVTEMIANTAAADPALASILEQMGLIEIGAEGEITVNFPDADATIGAINRMTLAFLHFQAVAENTTAYDLAVEIYGEEEAKELFGLLDENDGKTSTSTLTVEAKLDGPAGFGQALGGSIKSLLGIDDETTTIDVKGMVTEVDTSAFDTLGAVEVPVTPVITGLPTTGDGSSIMDGLAQDVEITVTQVGMETVIGLAQATQNAVEGIPTSWVTGISESGAAGVIGLANATANAIEDIPTSWQTTISLLGAESAIGSAHAIANAINNIPTSRTSTINVVTAYSSTGTPSPRQAHGGIPGFAGGGVPNWVHFIGAEGNRPELLHFAGGGTAPIFTEGVYAVPPATYVSPANANPGLRGGGEGLVLEFHFHAPVYGVEDLTERISSDIAPILEKVVRDARESQVRMP